MKKLLITILIMLSSHPPAIPQDSTNIKPLPSIRKNLLYTELKGSNVIFLSLNYERVFFTRSEKIHLSGRISTLFIISSIEGNLIYGSRYQHNFAEIGGGSTLLAPNFDLLFYLKLAYRMQPTKKGFFVRWGLYLFFPSYPPSFLADDAYMFPWLGLSLGYAF